MDLNKVALFVRVVDSQGFTAAAAALGVPKSSVSRGIAQLEEQLGTRLLHRTTRKSSLTDAGRAYYDLASRALSGLEEARVAVSCKEQTPTGRVKLTAPADLAMGVLSDLLVAFVREQPAIQVELVLTNRVLDLVDEGIDLALRPGKLRDSSLVAKRIGPLHAALFASPAYLKARGVPKNVAELADHDCIVFRPRAGGGTWKLSSPSGDASVDVKGPISADDFGFLHRVVASGAGIGLIPLFTAGEDLQRGKLVAVLPDYQMRGSILSLVYPSSRLMPRRVVLLRDFLFEGLTRQTNVCEKRLAQDRKDAEAKAKPRRAPSAAQLTTADSTPHRLRTRRLTARCAAVRDRVSEPNCAAMRSRHAGCLGARRLPLFEEPFMISVRRIVRHSLAPLACFAALLAAPEAFAQTPDSAATAAKATDGKNDITSDKFVATEKVSPDDKNASELSLSLGGLQSGGNARLLALTALGRYRLRRDDEQFKAAIAGNYGRSALPGQDWQTSVENIQGLARYDHFLGDFTLFFAAQGRNDKFQGLDLRLRLDPGVGYYFVNQADQQFWTEVGYDFRYDVRRDDALAQLDATGAPEVDAKGAPILLPKTAVLHSARVFLGYGLKMNETVTLSTGAEFLQGLSDTKQYSINSDASLALKLGKALAIAFAISERYDAVPLPGKQNLDTTTSASLVYTFL